MSDFRYGAGNETYLVSGLRTEHEANEGLIRVHLRRDILSETLRAHLVDRGASLRAHRHELVPRLLPARWRCCNISALQCGPRVRLIFFTSYSIFTSGRFFLAFSDSSLMSTRFVAMVR